MQKSDFGSDFKWGVAAASYQIEGAWQADGKGESIWDRFSHTKGKIQRRETGDKACEFYTRFASDLKLMRSMNIRHYRFSISWSRIFPKGFREVNEAGVDFYNQLIDECLKNGIEPWVTLYHWDLPQHIEDLGGWSNRDIIAWFSDYADLCSKRFGDRVKKWMILNEPVGYTALGYLLGIHAPGVRNPFRFLKAVHHTAMCQAEGFRIVKANVPDSEVGTTFSCGDIQPYNGLAKHQAAANRLDALLNRLMIEPALGLGYPTDTLPILKRVEKHMKVGDAEKLKANFDFIGLQYYTREVVKRFPLIPYLWAWWVKPEKRGAELITEMDWEVYPEGLTTVLKRFSEYEGVKKIYITENGAAFPDKVVDGQVNDPLRTQYLKDHFAAALAAKRAGVPLEGHLIWTFMDNFEWAEGYRPRFGLVHVDFETQKRIVKDSGKWLQNFLKE